MEKLARYDFEGFKFWVEVHGDDGENSKKAQLKIGVTIPGMLASLVAHVDIDIDLLNHLPTETTKAMFLEKEVKPYAEQFGVMLFGHILTKAMIAHEGTKE